MQPLHAAIYARVSSDQQTADNTIASQLAALETRLTQEGLRVAPEHRFVDEGYSGATLVRPALERLRDAAAAGLLDRVYVHSPDRLARRYAYQVLLIDEFRRAGVEVVFLNRAIGLSPEDDLLLQVQGMVAEYERAKILERSRRGKRHAAREGAVANRVDDDVVGLAALCEVLSCVIDHTRSAERPHKLRVARTADTSHYCAEVFRQLHRGGTHRA